MHKALEDLFSGLIQRVIGYLPDLLAGVALVLIGWFLGWLFKRVIIQIAGLLKLERFLVRFRWGEDLSKADVRYGFYNLLGNIAFFVIFLIFLIDAFSVWKLTILSDLLERGVLFLPKIIVALMVFGFGWLISSWASRSLQKALRREEIPRATLIARFSKTMLMVFFSAMAIAELDIAREVVLIGFATIFVTLGFLTVVGFALGGKSFMKKIGESLEEK
jgi:hypothetical protein